MKEAWLAWFAACGDRANDRSRALCFGVAAVAAVAASALSSGLLCTILVSDGLGRASRRHGRGQRPRADSGGSGDCVTGNTQDGGGGSSGLSALAAGLDLLVHRLLAALRPKHNDNFEYGSLEITSMTPKAAKSMLLGSGLGTPFGNQKHTSLVPEVLQDLEDGLTGTAAAGIISLEPGEEVDRRAKALAEVGAPPFRRMLRDGGLHLARARCDTLQLNIGLYCNQACTHCHVESSPLRKEWMTDGVVDRCLLLLQNTPSVQVLDITGGAPELNPGFRRLVEGAATLRDRARPALRIIDRCNLTVLLEPGQEDLCNFLVRHKVDVIASLPSYDEGQTDRQRGRKVFQRSVEALKILNRAGYGRGGRLRLDLVFNPPGPFLPPRQEQLESKYKRQMKLDHGIDFDNLMTIANMPIKRFFDFLRKQKTLEGYMDLLVRNFNPDTVPMLMCIGTVNVGWDGRIFDCDFNQQLDLTIGRPALTVFDLETLDDERLRKAPIRTDAHCFGCTAAQGSS